MPRAPFIGSFRMCHVFRVVLGAVALSMIRAGILIHWGGISSRITPLPLITAGICCKVRYALLDHFRLHKLRPLTRKILLQLEKIKSHPQSAK